MDTDSARFYLLRSDSDPSVLGVKSGIKQADICRAGFSSPQRFDELKEKLGTNKYWEIKDSLNEADFEIECVRLLPKAKLTDFLQFGPALIGCPFMVSQMVEKLLSEHNLQAHRLFPARVEKNGGSLSYYLLCLFQVGDSLIDFSKSIFRTGNEMMGEIHYKVASAEDRRALAKSHVDFRPKQIGVTAEARKLDLFMIGAEIVISERLKDELEMNSCTSGVKILPAFGDVRWPTVV